MFAKIGRIQFSIYPLLSFLIPFVGYILTLAPTFIPVDGVEYTDCMFFWGICHPPGYPLYIFIGKIFLMLFPFGPMVFKANLLSSIFASLTCFFLYLTLRKLALKMTLSLLLALLMAVSPDFWEFSVYADVFTMSTFLMSLTLYLYFSQRLKLAFFCLGLLTSHFYISLFLFPILIWPHIWPDFNFKKLFVLGFCFSLGLFPQLILFIRMQESPQINWGHARTLWDFWNFIRRKEFSSFFLISGGDFKFSFLNFFKNYYAFLQEWILNFGLILPFIALFGLFSRRKPIREVFLIGSCVLLILGIQMLVLSTVDPLVKGKLVQITKFYLLPYILSIPLLGIYLRDFLRKLPENIDKYLYSFLVLIILINLYINFNFNNFTNDFFSQYWVEDALDELPPNSLAITVEHTFYFGGLYEQKILKKYPNSTLAYIYNKNNDLYLYNPSLKTKALGQESSLAHHFIKDISRNNLNDWHKYVLNLIISNLDKSIYILQGNTSQALVDYYKPYLVSYGLWWKVEIDPKMVLSAKPYLDFDSSFRNKDLKIDNFSQLAQANDVYSYILSYHSLALQLGSQGNYDLSKKYFQKALSISNSTSNIPTEIATLDETSSLEKQYSTLLNERNITSLSKLAQDYYTVGNFSKAAQVYQKIIDLDSNNSALAYLYNNLGTCLTKMGDYEQAKYSLNKALALSPNLELAKNGLKFLEDD